MIFHDTTLAALAEAMPTTNQDLLAVPGIGPVKVDRYGTDVLRVVAAGIDTIEDGATEAS